MNSASLITTLGECRFDSPVESAVFIDDDRVLIDVSLSACRDCKGDPPSFEAAGPRKRIFFEPARTSVAIVTCGGLCPGLNDVIRALVMVSWYRYGIRNIRGLRYGYEGLVKSIGHKPITLDPDTVEDIHQHGGTILGSSRGPQDPAVMTDYLVENGIDILFAIGGDGTQRGALKIAREIERRSLSISVVGIPKTIDNDIAFTERTFGFETAVAASQPAITCAHMEAKGVRNGIGLVKLMGRESGFVAVHASLASSDVNLLLIPELPFAMENIFAYLEERLARKAHAVIVAAEGAGQNLVSSTGTDKSGNRKLGDIGPFLKSALTDHFAHAGIPTSVKYIDPSYTIRSIPANADDSVFCFQLAENAVHAAISGRTSMVVSLWNGHFIHVPIERAVGSRKTVDTSSLLWQSVLDNTGQPARLTPL
ncbi:MAG: ATP-dependent 6-phosphofructokinase [Lentisphaerales bacterium]|nr:MAG: ATP-dependent 6-phosphofructokinase [Lentisphaerales bacterium]